MKKYLPVRSLQLLAAFSLMGIANSGWATSWALDSGCGTKAGATTCAASGGISLTAQAYSTGTGGTVAAPTAGTKFAAAQVTQNGASYGLGVISANEDNTAPNHTMDNASGTDLIVLHFGSAINLSSIMLGYTYQDADLTVMAYTGAASTPTILNNTTSSFSASNGWTSVQNYFTAAGAKDTTDVNVVTNKDTTTFSSWWVISAYNSGFGGAGAGDSVSDYVKLMTVAGNTKASSSRVPEPGSLALMGAGLLGLLATRRKSNTKRMKSAA